MVSSSFFQAKDSGASGSTLVFSSGKQIAVADVV